MPPLWPTTIFFEHTGRSPRREWSLGSVFGHRPTWEQKQSFLEYLHRSARRIGKRGDWIVTEFEREFGRGSWEPMAKRQAQIGRDR
jgi:hypothetical protein